MKIGKKALIIFAGTKVPILIYLVLTLATVPTISAVQDNYIQGAHRGASLDFEENTLKAFEKALNESKYNFIEFDIQYSEDKKIIVFHQNNIFRIPKKGIEINNLTYKEIQEKFEFGVPVYQEVMNLISNKKPVNIEIKSHGNFIQDKELVDFVIEDCRKRQICKQIMLSSSSEEIIKYIEENYPEIQTGKIYWLTLSTIMPTEDLSEHFISYTYEKTDADFLLMHGYNIKNYKLLKELKPENKRIAFWYFTDEIYLIQEPGEPKGFWCIDETLISRNP